MKLKPNCLLTRRPLKLVSGPKSLFYYRKPWGALPDVLFEHGYKAEVIALPFNDKALRKKALLARLTELNNAHIIVDDMTYIEFQNELKNIKNSTLTITGETFKPGYTTFSLSYALHSMWIKHLGFSATAPQNLFIHAQIEHWYAFIDHCVKLAELDFLE